MTEIRCIKCNRLLMKSNGNQGIGIKVEVKCSKCSYIGVYDLGYFQLIPNSTIEIAEVKDEITVYSIK